MKSHLLFFSLVLYGSVCFGQKTVFHKYYETESDYHISQWKINKNKLPNWYLQETVDSVNRVIELKLFNNGRVEDNNLCYLHTWIKYEYPNDTTIIEYYLNSSGEEDAVFECDMPSKTIFFLSKDKRTILKTISEYNFDEEFYLQNGWTGEELKKVIDKLKSEDGTDRFVSYYKMSYYKLNGIFPISKDFTIEHFLFSDKEKRQILKSISNITKQ